MRKVCCFGAIFRAFIALAFAGTLDNAGAAGPARTPFPMSIREVAQTAAPAGARPRPFVARTVLTAAEGQEPMTFEIALRMRNFAELQGRIANGERIAPTEMQARYFPSAADYARTAAWVRAEGLDVTRTDDNRLAVFGRGTVGAVARAFQVRFARVNAGGVEYTSAIDGPSLPADVAPPVLGIHGLQPHIRLHRMIRLRPQASSAATASYFPGQIAAAYNASSTGLTGSGQVIAVYENAFPATTDLTVFWSAAGVSGSLSNIQSIPVNGGPASPADSGSREEAALDVEWSSGIAPGAVIRVYGSNINDPASFDETYQQIYADLPSEPGLHQFSLSYGTGEGDFDQDYLLIEAQYMANLASAGVTVLVASGDDGADADGNGIVQPSYPPSDPSVTGVGGTTLILNANSAVTSETAWSGSGGGASSYFSRPAWQTGVGVPSGTTRLTPDVAAAADPNAPAAIVVSGRQSSVGGTSWSTPVWAAFCAMINQARSAAGQPPLGLLNPKIYPLLGTSAFRDITSGGNGTYQAGVGYDLCTGIGVPDVSNLIQALGNESTAPAITAQLGSQAVTLGQTATFAVAAEGGPPLSYQWERLPWGSESWTALVDNGTYSGSATADLAVSGASYAMNGDSFRCLVSNASGSAASAPAALNVDPVGVTTLAGWPDATGFADGTGRAARFNLPGSVRLDAAGNAYVADSGNNTIRRITPAGVVTTIAGSPGVAGTANGAAGTALFNGPSGVAVDASGNVYIADNGNYEIRKISPSGSVSTLAGSPGQQGTADGTGTGARFYDPQNIAIDGYGNLYVVDGSADTVRKIVIATGAVTTIAGSPNSRGSADGAGAGARFNDPVGVGTDSNGNVYVADSGNNTIRRMTPAGSVTTLAGVAGLTGSTDGTGSGARFNFPTGVAVDAADNIYVTDSGNDTIREISPALAVSTIAGAAGQAENIDGLAGNARFASPGDIALDSSNVLYIADTANNTVRRFVQGSLAAPAGTVTAPAPPSPVAAGSAVTLSVNVPAAAAATLQWQLNGVNIPGATGASYSIAVAGATDAGVYTVVAANEAGTTTLSAGTLQVATNARLFNLSSRAFAGTGNNILIAGFVAGGSGSKAVLIRGVGPTLANFGVTGALATPQLTLLDTAQPAQVIATNIGWGNASTLGSSSVQSTIAPATGAIMSSLGAFALPANSADCAMVATLPAAAYTAQVSGANGSTGIALAELYDADTGAPTARLINISSRAFVGTGNDILIAGFVIEGTTSETVLIRGVGPALANFNLTGVLAAPQLVLVDSTPTQQVIATNTGWGNASTLGPSTVQSSIVPATAAIMSNLGAFALPANSADCAMVATLPPGGYTVEVSGVNAATGIGLVEVYEVR